MRYSIKSFIAMFVMAAFVISFAPAAFAQAVSAKVVALEGDVTVKKDDKGEWTKASIGQELPEGAFIMTAFESSCDLEFVDKSKMKIKELSKIQINKYSTELKKVDAQMTLYNGSVKATVHKDVDTKTEFQVKTPVSTISVRGTEKEITTYPGFGTQVNTISGVVEVSNNVGQKVTITKDEETEVSEEIEPPKTMTQIVQENTMADTSNESVTKEEQEAAMEANLNPSSAVSGPSETVTEAVEEIFQQGEMGRLTVTWK